MDEKSTGPKLTGLKARAVWDRLLANTVGPPHEIGMNFKSRPSVGRDLIRLGPLAKLDLGVCTQNLLNVWMVRARLASIVIAAEIM